MNAMMEVPIMGLLDDFAGAQGCLFGTPTLSDKLNASLSLSNSLDVSLSIEDKLDADLSICD